MKRPIKIIMRRLVCGLPLQCGHDTYAVDVGRDHAASAGKLGQRWHDVLKAANKIADAWSDLTWPAGNEGNANPALRQISLDSTERTIAVVKVGIVSPFTMRPIVR